LEKKKKKSAQQKGGGGRDAQTTLWVGWGDGDGSEYERGKGGGRIPRNQNMWEKVKCWGNTLPSRHIKNRTYPSTSVGKKLKSLNTSLGGVQSY